MHFWTFFSLFLQKKVLNYDIYHVLNMTTMPTIIYILCYDKEKTNDEGMQLNEQTEGKNS